RILAEEMTRLIHGEEALAAAQRISASLFAEDQSALTESDFQQLSLDGLPAFPVTESINIVQALTTASLAKSNNEARGFISQGAVMVNGQKIDSADYAFSSDDKRFGHYTILRRGKRNHALLVWQ
ncbi:Tyrosyl-tRNA synthetase, partial [Snodgrassella alvi SCGC AB-598-O11]